MSEMDEKLWELCRGFVEKQKISCAETIYQCDNVIENAAEFIERICDIVGYKEEKEWHQLLLIWPKEYVGFVKEKNMLGMD